MAALYAPFAGCGSFRRLFKDCVGRRVCYFFFGAAVTMWLVGQGIGQQFNFFCHGFGVRAFDRWWIYEGW